MKMLTYFSTLALHILSYGIILKHEQLDLRILILVIPICLLVGFMIKFFTNSNDTKTIAVGHGLLFASGTSIILIVLFNAYIG